MTSSSDPRRLRVIARRIAIALIVVLLLYPVSYVALRVTKVLVHRAGWAFDIPVEETFPALAEEFPVAEVEGESAFVALQYDWHSIGRGAAWKRRPLWGERSLPAFYRPLIEGEMLVRGHGRVPVSIVEIRTVSDGCEGSKTYTRPPEPLAQRTYPRWALPSWPENWY